MVLKRAKMRRSRLFSQNELKATHFGVKSNPLGYLYKSISKEPTLGYLSEYNIFFEFSHWWRENFELNSDWMNNDGI